MANMSREMNSAGVTIKDIAKICGVSITTVSRVVNGRKEGVGAKTRQRVLDAIQTSGYQPNPIARSMITKKTNTVALVIPDICNPFFAELVRGVGDACAEAGYHLFLSNTDGSVEEERDQVQFLREHLVDGIIITTQNTREDNALIEGFLAEGYPFVVVERYMDHLTVPLQVTIDNQGGISKLVTYLVERGHRKIAYICGAKDAINANQRFEGYKAGLAKHGIAFDPRLCSPGDYKMQSGYDGAKRLMQQGHSFTAIIAANDLMAIGACNAIADAGLLVPEDISVAGFDNLPLTGMIHPRITTAGVSINRLGRTAADLLCQRLAGDKKERHIFMECDIVVRNSIRDIGENE